MNHLISFINKEKSNNEEKINQLSEKIKKTQYDIQSIEKKIIECTKNIDMTYEVFSPNAFDKDYNVLEIENLNMKKQELLIEVEVLNEQKDSFISRQNELELAISDIAKFNQSIEENKEYTKSEIESVKKNEEEKFSQEITSVLELQIEKAQHEFTDLMNENLDIIKTKIDKCQEFYQVDINRTRTELLNLGNEIEKLKESAPDKMFHVKHLNENSKSELREEIESFIKKYKKTQYENIEFHYSGEKLMDSSYNIINVLRIMEEAIKNSIKHSNCNKIVVNVNVEHYMSLFDTQEKEKNQDIQEDLHQINFVIERPVDKYIIMVQITDDGDGFILSDRLVNSGLGIKIMQYRAHKLHGNIQIESNPGFGTVITTEYEVTNS